MGFENWAPKKQETPVENTVENNESIESQIEEQEQMQILNPKLDALKVEIDGMGGVEGLDKMIKNISPNLRDGLGFSFGALIVVLNLYFSESASTEALRHTALLTAGFMGYPTIHTAVEGLSRWLKNKKLKSSESNLETEVVA